MRFFRINITYQFIAYLMFMSFLPLLVVGVLSNRIASNTLQQQANRFVANLVRDQRDYLDLQAEQIETLIINLVGTEDIRDTLESEAATTTFTRISTQARIGNVLNRYINSIDQLASIEIFTTSGQHFYVGDTLNADDIREDIRDYLFEEALAADQSVAWVGIVDNVNINSNIEKVIVAASIMYRFNQETLQQEPVALLTVNYRPDAFYEHFTELDFGAGSFLVVTDSANRLIYHPNRDLIGTPLSDNLVAALSADTDPDSSTTDIDGIQYTVNDVRSNMTGWTIATFVPVSTLIAPVTIIEQATIYVLVASFVIVALVAFIYNRNVVSPIRQVIQRFQLLQTNAPDAQSHLPRRGAGEISELVSWFNIFLDNLITKQRTEDQLRQRLIYEKNIAELSANFINVPSQDVDATISEALATVGRVMAFDRVAIFLLRTDDDAFIQNTHEWVAEGIPETKSDFQAYPVKSIQPFIDSLSQLKIMYYPGRADVPPQWSKAPRVLAERQTETLVTVPMAIDGALVGFMTFETAKPVHWDQETIGLLGLIGQIITTALQRRRVEREREQLIDQLRTANAVAQESARLKSEFLATMSHEIRTPLNAIEGFTGVMLEGMAGVEMNDKAQRYVERISANSQRLLALINDFLDVSRIESGQMKLSNLPIHPALLAEKWQSELGLLAENKDLAFNVTVDPKLPEVILGDAEALSKITLNLLGNAIKFTHEGSVSLTLQERGESWAIIVEDTGIGIPEDAQEYIFEEFRQVDQSSTRAYGGTGLGLSIVSKFARLMNGAVSVRSEVGKGSRFIVLLPLLVPQTESKTPQIT